MGVSCKKDGSDLGQCFGIDLNKKMSEFKNHSSQNTRLFIDYIPAELKQTQSDDWRIVYYCKIPGKEKLKRFRKRVPNLQNKTLRRKLAKKICEKINRELAEGWSPFFDGKRQGDFQLFSNILKQFVDQAKRKLKDGSIRKDSLRSYVSFSNNINSYINKKNPQMMAAEFDRHFIIDFLDYIYFEKKRTARTSNNYLSFLNQVGIFMEDRKYVVSNPAAKIPKRKEVKKKREYLPDWLRNDILNYWKTRNINYLTLCLTTYFCFIRRTELTKLLVKHVNLKEGIIFIPGDASKNRRDGTVTIPKKLISLLAEHISQNYNSDFLFSADDFKPGKFQLAPKKISDEWAKMRAEMAVDSKYQFYSLKDTGITNLLLMGVPAKKVRDQARHYDIRITESYISRTEEADEEIRTIDFKF